MGLRRRGRETDLPELRLQLCEIKLLKSNISQEKAINSLKTDDIITIVPADKGWTPVAMDTDTYHHQVGTMSAHGNT